MGNAPAMPAQTPVMFVLAGGGDAANARCKKALVNCGYDPEWIGSYSHTKKQIDEAGKKCSEYDKWAANKKRKDPGPPKPDDADRFLARSQSGHMSQNAIYKQPNGRTDNCSNHVGKPAPPDPPAAACYDDKMAPCMPHPGQSNTPGAPHQVITATEPANAKKNAGKGGVEASPGDPMTPAQINKTANQTSDIALAGASGNAKGVAGQTPCQQIEAADKLDAKRRPLENKLSGKGGAKKISDESKRAALKKQCSSLKTKSTVDHQAAYARSQQRSAAALRKRHKIPKPTAKELAEDIKIAKECLEKFRKAAMDKMRQDNVDQYASANAKPNEAKAKKEAAAARAEHAKAKAAAKGKPKDSPEKEKEREAAQKLKDAEKRHEEAARIADDKKLTPSERCTREQADMLLKNHATPGPKGTTSFPPFTGQVPGAR